MGSISSQDRDLFGLRYLKPITTGIIGGAISVIAYLMVVVITTPALPPISSIQAALNLNWPIVIGIGIGVGSQLYLTSYGKKLGCRLANRRTVGSNTSTTAFTSFFSFFSLVPLGCCGWWLYLISFLPSIFGVGVSAALIQYSNFLSYVGLAIIFAFNGITALKLIKEKRIRSLNR